MPRSRSRTERMKEFVPDQYVYTETANGLSVRLYSRGSGLNRAFKTESMTDENTGLHIGIKPCVHRKVLALGGIVKVPKLQSVDSAGRKTWIDTYKWTEPSFGNSMPNVTVTASNQQAVQNAINGVLDTGTLAPVTFSELPQLKGTFDTLREAKFGRKDFANKYLAYKFGVLPFIGDLNALLHGHEKIKAHIKKVNSRQGKPVKIRITSGSITGSYGYNVATSDTTTEKRYVDWTGSRKTHVTLMYTRRLEQGDTIRAALDYYGAHILSIGWEKIPYSFVADWFFDIGGILDLLQPKFQVPCTRVLSTCNITKASLSVPVFNWDSVSKRAVSLGSIEVTQFSRDAAPVTFNSLLGSGLSLSKASIGAALYFQKK